MITHVVMFKLKDNSKENVQKAKEVLMSMDGKVEQLRHLEVGIDVLHSERSYDIVLITKFDSMKDLDAYQEHPYHVEVVKKHMHSVRESSVAVDFEC
ncbi:MAG: Dabb family protein [Clostridia bacterium]|nr:Dabb family protein [Clostridia bacterium]